MILTFRHRGDTRGNQKYTGDNLNIALSGGFPSSVFSPPPVPGSHLQSITNNLQFLQLPINCVIAGQQPGQEEEIPAKVSVGMLGIIKRIFGE